MTTRDLWQAGLIGGMDWPGALAASAAGLIPVSLLMGSVMMRTGNILAPGLFQTFANRVSAVS